MLRKRIIVLEIETDEGRPEDWDWQGMLFKQHTSDNNKVTVCHWEKAE